ncbi:7597_t:CDS:2, partial [Scutellospora calospora]
EVFPKKSLALVGGSGDMSGSNHNVIERDLKERQQAPHYYTRTYRSNGVVTKSIVITETAVPFVPPPDVISGFGTLTLYYPTCNVFACHWGFTYNDTAAVRTIGVKFVENSPPVTLYLTSTITTTVNKNYQNIPTTTVSNNTYNSLAYDKSNNLYQSDVKYIVVGTIGGAVVGILSEIEDLEEMSIRDEKFSMLITENNIELEEEWHKVVDN